MNTLLNKKIEPDVQELIEVLKRRKRPRRVHHLELFLDPEVKQKVVERFDLGTDLDLQNPHYWQELDIRVHRFLGYDVFRASVIRKDFFDMTEIHTDDTAADMSRGERDWAEEHHGPIQNWADFEAYSWPKIEDVDLSTLEWMEKNLPDNMGCYDLTAHILEMVTFLLGYETMCYALFDDPALIDAVCEKIGPFYTAYTKLLCDFDCVALVWGSDDMGFRSSTMVSPQFLKEKILPWHKRCADIAHEAGKPYLLHACGNLDELMPHLIDVVGIDGKHSYEDTILPVTQAFDRYGDQTAILGGVDVDFLCRADEQAIRSRVRRTLDHCMPGTGYCLGTGNTVANYIPLDNYLIMLDEGRRYTI